MKNETGTQLKASSDEFEFEDPQERLLGVENDAHFNSAQFSSSEGNLAGAAAAAVPAHSSNNVAGAKIDQDADIHEVNTMSSGSAVAQDQPQQPKDEESWKVDLPAVLVFTVQNNSRET